MATIEIAPNTIPQRLSEYLPISAKVLFIDDEESVLKAITKVFGSKYELYTASSGAAGLELLDNEGPFAVIVCDLKMPVMSGIDVLATAKAKHPETFRIMLTGQADLGSAIEAINRGELFRFLIKPVPTDDLALALDSALEFYRMHQEYLRTQEYLRLDNAGKDRFISILAHDLRNPLHEIIFSSEYLLQKSQAMTPERRTSMIDGIRRASRRISDLLENLLAWSRLHQGSLVARPQTVTLRTLTDTEIEVIRPSAVHKGIELNIDIDPQATEQIDPNIYATIIRNLVTNAIKFTPSGGSVQIVYQEDESEFSVNVVDDGPGIPADRMQDILKHRISTPGTAQEAGTGLGLQICAELIKISGGHFEVDSELGKGTVFSMIVPK